MAHYLIEFRMGGFAKRYSQELIRKIARRFKVRGMEDKVSHISLYGPFITNSERKVVSEILNLCRRYNRVYFSIKGIDYFDNPSNKVVYLDILPSEELKMFRFELASRLRRITTTSSKEDTKNKEDFKFHSTIAFKDIDNKLREILGYLKHEKHPNIRQTLLRITILKNGRILNEYDFLQKKLFDRRQSLNKNIWRKTIVLLKQRPYPTSAVKISTTPKEKHSLLDKIKSFFGVR